LYASVREGYIPVPLLARESRRFGTPVAAILFMTASTLVLTNFSFAALLGVDTIFNAVNTLLVSASFLRLRLAQPDRSRPFRVPGGTPVAWVVAGAPFAFAVAAIGIAAVTSWVDIVIALCVVAAVYGVGWARELCSSTARRGGGDGDGDGGEEPTVRKGLLSLNE
jgi:amino acid transporter